MLSPHPFAFLLIEWTGIQTYLNRRKFSKQKQTSHFLIQHYVQAYLLYVFPQKIKGVNTKFVIQTLVVFELANESNKTKRTVTFFLFKKPPVLSVTSDFPPHWFSEPTRRFQELCKAAFFTLYYNKWHTQVTKSITGLLV